MAFFPYSPLFQGLLTDDFPFTDGFPANDVRSENPKLNGENLTRHLKARADLKAVAERAGLSLTHLALAWLTNNPAGHVGHLRRTAPGPDRGQRRCRRRYPAGAVRQDIEADPRPPASRSRLEPAHASMTIAGSN